MTCYRLPYFFLIEVLRYVDEEVNLWGVKFMYRLLVGSGVKPFALN